MNPSAYDGINAFLPTDQGCPPRHGAILYFNQSVKVQRLAAPARAAPGGGQFMFPPPENSINLRPPSP